MAIKIQWEADGPFATCDTVAEAVELLKEARTSSNGGARGKPESLGPKTMDEKMTAIFAGVNDKAKKFLKALLNYPAGVEGDEFAKVCGTEAAGFGGVLGGISKKAKKQGLTIDDLVLSEVRFDNERRYRRLAPMKLLIEHKGKLK